MTCILNDRRLNKKSKLSHSLCYTMLYIHKRDRRLTDCISFYPPKPNCELQSKSFVSSGMPFEAFSYPQDMKTIVMMQNSLFVMYKCMTLKKSLSAFTVNKGILFHIFATVHLHSSFVCFFFSCNVCEDINSGKWIQIKPSAVCWYEIHSYFWVTLERSWWFYN